MGSVSNNVSFGNEGIYQSLQKGGEEADAKLQKQLGGYTKEQLSNLKSIKAEHFRQVVNYVNPKNKGAACFTSDLKLTKCNNKVDIGSLRIGLNAQKNVLMRQTFANALTPGLKYITDTDKLNALLSAVTGKSVIIAGKKPGAEIMLGGKDGIVFSTDRLERKDIREAFKIYDESFNTVKGRISVLEAMLKSAGLNEADGSKWSVKNFIDHVGSENFVDGLVRELNEKFNMPEDRVRSLLNEMLAVSEDKDKAEKSEVKSEGEYVDRSDAMKLSSDTFLEKLNELEEAINQAAKEKDLNRDLAVLLRNHAADPRQISNPKIREKLEGLLQDAVARFRGVGKNLINRPLSAFSSDFGGKRPLNIFLDMQFDKVLNTLLDKYSGKIGSGNFAKDLAAGSQMYSDMVEIASAFLDKVNLLETAYQNHVRTVSPNLFAQQDDQVVDLNVNNVNVHLEKMDNLDVMAESKELRDFEFDSTRVFDLVIKASALGVDVTDGSGKKLRIPSRVGAGIALESMVKTFAEKLDVYQFYKDIINGADTKTKGAVCKLGENLLNNVEKDLNAYGKKLKFCSILGNAKPENGGKIALTSHITNTMNEAFALIEGQFKHKGLFESLKSLFTSEVNKGLEDVASKIFKEQVLSSLLARFYNTQFGKALDNMEKGEGGDISATFNRAAPLLLVVEKLAGKLMDSLKKGNEAFKTAMSQVENNKKTLGLAGKDLEDAKEAMIGEYENQLGESLKTVFGKIDFNRLNAVDVKDSEAVINVADGIVKDIAKDLKTTFGNNVNSVETALQNVTAGLNKEFKDVGAEVQTAFAYKDAEIAGETIAFSNPSGTVEFKCRADTLLFGNNGVVKAVFDKVCNKKTFATYLKFAKALSASKTGFTVHTYMSEKNRLNALTNEKKILVGSMKGYLESMTGAVFKELQGTFKGRLMEINKQRLEENKNPLYADDNGLAMLADHATVMFLRENEKTVGDFVKSEFENAYLKCVDGNGKIELPEFNAASVKTMFGAKNEADQKIGDFITRAEKSGVEIALTLRGELEEKDICVKGHKEFGKLIDPNDDIISIAVGTYPAEKKNSETWKKYGFLSTPAEKTNDFDYQFFGDHVYGKIYATPTLAIALMGRTNFCAKLMDDFNRENYVEKFEKYLDQSLEAFKTVETFGFSEEELDPCRRGAIYRHVNEDKASGETALMEKIFDVGAAVKSYEQEVFKLLLKKVATLKRESSEVRKLFMAVEKHVQSRVDKLSELWEKEYLRVGANPSSEVRFASEMQKAVLKQFNAKFVAELLNQTWLNDNVQDEVIQAIRGKGSNAGIDITNYLRNDGLEQRIEKLNLVITNMMDGIYAANNGSAFKKLIRESIESLEKSNPEQAKELKEFYTGNKRQSVQTLITNLESLDFYKEMISSAASRYWNDCCKSGVFDKIKTEASINLKPVEEKPVEKKTVEQSVEQKKPVEPGNFSIDFSKVDDAKAQTLKNVVLDVLTGGKVSQEIGNLQDADFENAVKVLDDDKFLRELYSRKFNLEFKDGVWKDVQDTLKDTFIKKYKGSLKAGIEEAFARRKDGVISFAKTELTDEMFKNAYDFVLRTRWQSRISGSYPYMDATAKKGMLISLSELLGDKATKLMTPANGDRQAVRVLIEKREAMQMSLLGGIVPLLPLDKLFPADEDRRNFINEEAPDKAMGLLKMQRTLTDCLQTMLGSQLRIGADVKPDKEGTLEQRLAFYKDFCAKSLDRIETTRTGFDNGLSQKYVNGDGFSHLIMSDLVLQDDGDVTKKFGTFGLEANDTMSTALKGTAQSMPGKIKDVRNTPIADRDEYYKYLSGFEEFLSDLKVVQGIVATAAKGSKIHKVAENLFGSTSGTLTAAEFADGMGGKLGGLLKKLEPLFSAAIRHELDKRESDWTAREKVVRNKAEQSAWEANLRKKLLDDGVPEASLNFAVAQQWKALIKLHEEHNPGLTTAETNKICREVLDLVVKGAWVPHAVSQEDNVQDPKVKNAPPKPKVVAPNATNEDVIRLLGKDAKLIEGAIAGLKNLTPATKASKHRDSFNGFVQRYAVLRDIIRLEGKWPK